MKNGISSRRKMILSCSYASTNPPSTRSPVISTTSGRGRRAITASIARSVIMLVSTTRLAGWPRGRRCRSVIWAISMEGSLQSIGRHRPRKPAIQQPQAIKQKLQGRSLLDRRLSRAMTRSVLVISTSIRGGHLEGGTLDVGAHDLVRRALGRRDRVLRRLLAGEDRLQED